MTNIEDTSPASIAVAATDAFHELEIRLTEYTSLLLLAQQSRDISDHEGAAMGALWQLGMNLLDQAERQRVRFDILQNKLQGREPRSGAPLRRNGASMDTEHLDG